MLSWQLGQHRIDAGHVTAGSIHAGHKAGDVAVGSIHAGHKAPADRIADDDDRDRRGADLLHQFLERGKSAENDHANFAQRQIDQMGGQALVTTICEAVFDSDIAAFAIANVSKATAE
jgi:hypothetical protein